jgi:ammonia channel protein AmtB
MLLLGFSAVCTAGILLPLHFTIGIRLSKEDEIKGLDVTGKIFDLFMKIEK